MAQKDRTKRQAALRLLGLAFEEKLRGPVLPPIFTISSPQDEAEAEDAFERLRAVSKKEVVAVFLYCPEDPAGHDEQGLGR